MVGIAFPLQIHTHSHRFFSVFYHRLRNVSVADLMMGENWLGFDDLRTHPLAENKRTELLRKYCCEQFKRVRNFINDDPKSGKKPLEPRTKKIICKVENFVITTSE